MTPAAEMYTTGQDLLAQRRPAEALRFFDAAQHAGLAIEECAAARWDCWMLLGKFERAWAESDLIAATGAPDPHRVWDGRPWAGQRVMLRCLHGLGDTLQFIRYAPLLRATCRELTVQTHPQLKTLLNGVAGVDHVTTWGDVEPPWDIQMEVTQLPLAFRATVQSLPSQVPYVRVPPPNSEWARAQLPPRQGLRIGVCWQAGPWDPSRSIPLGELEPLLAEWPPQIFGLQKGAQASGFENLERHCSDVRDTAAFILNLDLVITVDTMTAHLAGALGRPVWILLPAIADWRWMLDRRDTPWYPNARLFRQVQPGNWTLVIAEVADALRRYGSAGGDWSGLPLPTDTYKLPSHAKNR